MKNLSYKKQKGFTLLFAVLLSTLIISIGATIMSIALRQTLLSGTSRESQYAFYAANTVLECAFYWDVVGTQPIDPENDTGIVFPADGETITSAQDDIKCAGINIVTGAGGDQGPWDDTTTPDQTKFKIKITDELSADPSYQPHAPYCAEATVIKTLDAATGLITTRIEAKGYNTCDTSNTRRVERGLV